MGRGPLALAFIATHTKPAAKWPVALTGAPPPPMGLALALVHLKLHKMPMWVICCCFYNTGRLWLCLCLVTCGWLFFSNAYTLPLLLLLENTHLRPHITKPPSEVDLPCPALPPAPVWCLCVMSPWVHRECEHATPPKSQCPILDWAY